LAQLKPPKYDKKHLKNKEHAANEIWKWVYLEMWFRDFVD